MLALSPGIRYWMYNTPADMRKGYDGLCGLVRNSMKRDPMTGDVFVFVSRSRVQIRMLWWDSDGYVLLSKRLERGRFDFPSTSETSRTLRRSELIMLLEGIRLSDTKQKVRYRKRDLFGECNLRGK